ncbi:MAG: homoserine dehydrogenase [Candidatus Omnitrophota bacterium]
MKTMPKKDSLMPHGGCCGSRARLSAAGRRVKHVNVGVIGFGTIGCGVVKVLTERRALLKEKTGIEIDLVRVCDKDLRSKRLVQIKKKGVLTKSISEVLYDPSIDVVVELIGGINPAKDIILEAIRQGKHVVTANKALLAQCGREIFELAARCGSYVEFEASVGGGIPIIRSLKDGLLSNHFELIYGIINGTSNFILSKMSREEIGFRDALLFAQNEGYAEKDPTLDVGGGDSAHKLAILALLGFGVSVKPDEIFTEGIERIEKSDIRYADELGYAVKLLAIAKRCSDGLELRVHPTLIPKDHLLASVHGVYNAIYVRGDLVGEALFYGEGAGMLPTASSVVADIASIAKKTRSGVLADSLIGRNKRAVNCKAMGQVSVRHYIRFSAIDRPGVLAAVSGILGEHSISIASVTQKRQQRSRIVPIVMMTHTASEADVSRALKRIDKLTVIKKRSVQIRIEE